MTEKNTSLSEVIGIPVCPQSSQILAVAARVEPEESHRLHLRPNTQRVNLLRSFSRSKIFGIWVFSYVHQFVSIHLLQSFIKHVNALYVYNCIYICLCVL
jgi:hypothetical protein